MDYWKMQMPLFYKIFKYSIKKISQINPLKLTQLKLKLL